MKYIFPVLFTLVLLKGKCQTITQQFNEPVIGEVDKNYKLDTSAYTSGLPIMQSGTNITWDLTKAFGMFPVIFDSIITPSAASSNTAYPGATYCQKRDIVYSFYKSTPGQNELLGAYSNTLSITFTNSAIVATYPINFGYSMTDPVSGTFKYGTQNGACNGSISVYADASGTLNFPNNITFTNVLRVRSVEEVTMSVSFFPVGTISQYIYSFYAPTKKYPVLTVQYQKYQLLTGTPTITALAYANYNYFTVAGIDESNAVNASVSVFPNPSGAFISVGCDKAIESAQLLDMSGSVMRNFNNTGRYDIGDVPSGLYLLRIQTPDGIAFHKVCRE